MSDESSASAPLVTANPKSLDELFSLDPMDLSDSNIDTVVLELRRMRHAFVQAEASGKKPPRAAKGRAAPSDLKLDDLL